MWYFGGLGLQPFPFPSVICLRQQKSPYSHDGIYAEGKNRLRDYSQLRETTNEYFDETVKRKRSDKNSRSAMDQGCILEEKIVQTTRLLLLC